MSRTVEKPTLPEQKMYVVRCDPNVQTNGSLSPSFLSDPHAKRTAISRCTLWRRRIGSTPLFIKRSYRPGKYQFKFAAEGRPLPNLYPISIDSVRRTRCSLYLSARNFNGKQCTGVSLYKRSPRCKRSERGDLRNLGTYRAGRSRVAWSFSRLSEWGAFNKAH